MPSLLSPIRRLPLLMRIGIFVRGSAVAGAVALLACADDFSRGDVTAYSSDWRHGNCGFESLFGQTNSAAQTYFAALNDPDWDYKMNCGRCASVKCTSAECAASGRPITVMITDHCGECAKGALDLSDQAFLAVTGHTPSRYAIEWSFVDCPSTFVSGNIEYAVKDGSSPWWFAIQPRNFARGVAKVELLTHGAATWTTLIGPAVNHIDSFYFLTTSSSGLATGPIQIRVTSIAGDVVVDSFPSLPAGDTTLYGKNQFGATAPTTTTRLPSTTRPPSTSQPPLANPSTSPPRPATYGPPPPTTLSPPSSDITTRPPPTTAPPSPTNSLAQPWQQCGGVNYHGPTQCTDGYACQATSPSYSQCRPSVAAPTPGASLAQPWQQCGGTGYHGPTTCTAGYTCLATSASYSQCTPATTAPPPGTLVDPWQQCGGANYNGATQCTAGYTCQVESTTYSQCTPSSTGRIQPWQQCGGADYTGPTQCTAGYTCRAASPSYSQCAPTTATTTTAPSPSAVCDATKVAYELKQGTGGFAVQVYLMNAPAAWTVVVTATHVASIASSWNSVASWDQEHTITISPDPTHHLFAGPMHVGAVVNTNDVSGNVTTVLYQVAGGVACTVPGIRDVGGIGNVSYEATGSSKGSSGGGTSVGALVGIVLAFVALVAAVGMLWRVRRQAQVEKERRQSLMFGGFLTPIDFGLNTPVATL
ncbi:Aste57867_9119 [Aphanomyces stellatus]|uniref:Aste57867_9119 protein n=1 Tax=Aphanomyces stellatus TaxID=120398 RepID=A0A485KME8_9STRA|nr:hypothetical protein As57867_009083 [Aphanomyces stellatus]VFT86003.1 Aste57867_9119 [Aphanomyces stellatus]